MPLTRRTLSRSDVWCVIEGLFAESEHDEIGLECEWPVYDVTDPALRPDLGVLESIARRPLPAAGNVTVEPGGQIELSSLPSRTLAGALESVARDSEVLHDRLAEWGLYPQTVAIDHERRPERILLRPRYSAMQQFFDAGGAAGRWMMCNTASVQVNISNGRNPQERWRLLNKIGPVMVAAFANSRGVDAHGTEWASLRQGIWWNIDQGRSRPVPAGPDLDPALAWFSYALSADVLYIGDEGCNGATGSAVPPGMSFGEWMHSGHPLGWPTVEDFRYHLTTLFPSIRPKGWYELRFLDALPTWMRTAATAVVATACQDATTGELMAALPDTSGLWLEAARHGLQNQTLHSAAVTLFDTVRTNQSMGSAGFDEVAQFATQYVNRRTSPSADQSATLPIRLETEVSGVISAPNRSIVA